MPRDIAPAKLFATVGVPGTALPKLFATTGMPGKTEPDAVLPRDFAPAKLFATALLGAARIFACGFALCLHFAGAHHPAAGKWGQMHFSNIFLFRSRPFGFSGSRGWKNKDAECAFVARRRQPQLTVRNGHENVI